MLYQMKRFFCNKKFLFLLCPPASGSSLLKELIEGCEAVSSFPIEGQWLDGVRNILGTESRWDPNHFVDWDLVMEAFLLHWDLRKPILLEKSPPHLVRAKQIEEFFDPCYFIILVRNPYAQIEGLLRRKWISSPEEAARFWIYCTKFQIRNTTSLKRTIFFRYEDFTDNTEFVLAKIKEFIPELLDLRRDRMFLSRNVTGEPIHGIQNLNERKIRLLGNNDITRISHVLREYQSIMDPFGYEIL